VTFTVAGNIGSADTGSPALYTGTWPAGVQITLILPPVTDTSASPANGMIVGKAGPGGPGGVTGGFGGPAIVADYPITIINNGIIGGGGGGGGGIRWDPPQYRGGWRDMSTGSAGSGGSIAGRNGAGITGGDSYRFGGSVGGSVVGTGGSLGQYGGGGSVGHNQYGNWSEGIANGGGGAPGACVKKQNQQVVLGGAGSYLGPITS
jgi:hypothetical protein